MSVFITHRSSARPVSRGSGTHGQDYKNNNKEPKQQRGYWIRHDGLWKCSVCNLEQIEAFGTCPMCGAVMDGEEE